MKAEFLCRIRSSALHVAIGLVALCLTLPASLPAQQGFASLEEQMTGEEFEAAGLDKLTPEELAALNEWIRARSLATLDAPRYTSSGSVTATAGGDSVQRSEIEEMERDTIVSRINGSFSGWDGQTVFKLENGMIWAQADNDKFYTREIQNPKVTIEPKLFGGWELSVEGHDNECKVERIQ